ncbi:rod shape-determining protein MreC [Actinoallomurus spadix]|uniref:Cell shape-determining protein MreC n=1 Tax=Actinoallomurus spadix TaxID=79912 RepID=A0ABN0VQW9_9ACTN|nr:rod shape-determining protein MreC [Actinoallomurus spadix]MCO5990723.1 rod shape-determining protein MreC [Actinoallomurus spadix]
MNDTRRTRAVLGVLLLISLAMITVDYRGGEHSPLRGLRSFGEAIFGPIEDAAAAVITPVGHALDTIIGSPDAHRRVDRLERENQRLRQQLRAQQIDKSRAEQLHRLLGTAGLGGYRIVAAQVISAGEGVEETVTIDAGSGDGVRTDMTVITGDGLVGRVTQVGPATSTVLLATDAASSVGGRLEGSGEIGVVRGTGRRSGSPLTFELLDSTVEIKPGQRIVSFGSQGNRPYVPGVPIGTVIRIERTPGSLTRTAIVRPFTHFTALDVVGVVVAPPKKNPRDAVLPPAPPKPVTPTPSPSNPGPSNPGPSTPGAAASAPTRRAPDEPSAAPRAMPSGEESASAGPSRRRRSATSTESPRTRRTLTSTEAPRRRGPRTPHSPGD